MNASKAQKKEALSRRLFVAAVVTVYLFICLTFSTADTQADIKSESR